MQKRLKGETTLQERAQEIWLDGVWYAEAWDTVQAHAQTIQTKMNIVIGVNARGTEHRIAVLRSRRWLVV